MKKWFTGFSMCWGMFCAIPNPIPPLGQRLLPADAPVPAFFRRRFRAYLDGNRPFAAAHFCAGTHFCPVHDGSALVSHRLYPPGRVYGLL